MSRRETTTKEKKRRITRLRIRYTFDYRSPSLSERLLSIKNILVCFVPPSLSVKRTRNTRGSLTVEIQNKRRVQHKEPGVVIVHYRPSIVHCVREPDSRR